MGCHPKKTYLDVSGTAIMLDQIEAADPMKLKKT